MTEHLGIDGLLEPEEIESVPVVLALVAAGLVVSCAVGAWVFRKLTRPILPTALRQDRAGEYWRY